MTKLKMGLIIGSASVGTIAVGAGIATGIILPKALEARDALDAFVPAKGENYAKDWNAKSKLNVVALGDSETAGREYTGKEGVSYAAYLANDLKKAGNLGEYHNFAMSGARIGDQHQLILESRSVQNVLEDADLITLTLGANDLLKYVNMFGSPMGADGYDKGSTTNPHATSDKLKANFGSDPITAGDTKYQANKLITQVKEIFDAFSTQNMSKALVVDKEKKDIVLDAIKRELMVMIRDIHVIAPKANIIVLGHAMPFAQWPKEVLNTKRPELGDISIADYYDKLLSSMEEGATKAISGNNNYTSFYRVDELHIHKSSAGSKTDDAKDIYKDYIRTNDLMNGANPNPNHWTDHNPMPSTTNIHPSAFGYELIGNSLFSKIAPYLGKTEKQAESYYTFLGTDAASGFEATTFDPTTFLPKELGLLQLLTKGSALNNQLHDYFTNPLVSKAIDVVIKYNEVIQGNKNIDSAAETYNELAKVITLAPAALGVLKVDLPSNFKQISDLAKTIISLANTSSTAATMTALQAGMKSPDVVQAATSGLLLKAYTDIKKYSAIKTTH